jgi:hypothetical protein
MLVGMKERERGTEGVGRRQNEEEEEQQQGKLVSEQRIKIAAMVAAAMRPNYQKRSALAHWIQNKTWEILERVCFARFDRY